MHINHIWKPGVGYSASAPAFLEFYHEREASTRLQMIDPTIPWLMLLWWPTSNITVNNMHCPCPGNAMAILRRGGGTVSALALAHMTQLLQRGVWCVVSSLISLRTNTHSMESYESQPRWSAWRFLRCTSESLLTTLIPSFESPRSCT